MLLTKRGARPTRQRGYIALGAMIALIGIIAITAAISTYMDMKSFNRLSQAEVIAKLKNQALSFRAAILDVSGKRDLPAIFTRYQFDYGNAQDGGTFCYEIGCYTQYPVHIHCSTRANVPQQYSGCPAYDVTDPYLIESHQTNPTVNSFFVGTVQENMGALRIASTYNIDIANPLSPGLGTWIYYNGQSPINGVILYMEVPATYNGKTNPYYVSETLSKLQKAIGDNEAVFCSNVGGSHRIVIPIGGTTVAAGDLCNAL